MNLWLSSHFLVAGLFLSSWALTPEECQPLVTPLSLADPSAMYGVWNFIAGYATNEVYISMLKKTESCLLNITASTSNPKEAVIAQKNKMNGTCMSSSVALKFDGNTGSMLMDNFSSEFHLLPSCEGCLLMSINSTVRNLDRLLDQVKFNSNATGEEIHAHSFYLMARESTIKDSDLEQFKKQASCFGYSREPDFHYDPKNDVCADGEGIKIKF